MADIIQEAKDRFKACQEWESEARKLFIDDYKFAHGDADNGFQWPDTLLKARKLNERPALTINKTRQHCLMILNDQRQNKVAIKISPTGDMASYASAEVFEDIIRHIEYKSHAEGAYDIASQFQVYSGIGYWRVVTDYVSPNSFDQDIYIRPILDPLTVYLDPDIQERDGSDARFGFIFQDLPIDRFKAKYPRYKDITRAALDNESGWITKDHVRVAEYFRKSEKRDVLYSLDNGTLIKKSKLAPNIIAELEKDPGTKKRNVIDDEITRYLLIGTEIAETTEWAGKFVPIVRVIGEETIIDGILDRKGHTRALKDPQRMYNYWSSASVEAAALQAKSPYLASMESTEGLETYWETANRINHAYLPYKAYDDEGRPLPPPSRPAPPAIPPAFVQAMEAAANEMQMVSGQYEAQMGEPSNERTGVAINNRQRQADNSTYHYIDNKAVAIRFTGRILIDLIPKIYDTQRVIKVLSEEGEESQITVNPSQQQALIVQGAERIFNPNVGQYEVESDVGPAFATKRQEAFAALTQLASSNKELMQVGGDLIMRAADFPMADELADRLKRMIPQQAMGGPTPEMMQMQQQVQRMQELLTHMTQELADKSNRTREINVQKDIDVYKAETERMKALGAVDPAGLAPLVQQLVVEALAQHLRPVSEAQQ